MSALLDSGDFSGYKWSAVLQVMKWPNYYFEKCTQCLFFCDRQVYFVFQVRDLQPLCLPLLAPPEMWWRRRWTSVGSPSSWVTRLASETARTWWRERASAALGKGSAWKPFKVGLLLQCFAFVLIERNEDWCSNTCTGRECKRVFIAKCCIMYDLTEHIGLQTNAKWPWKQRKEEISHFCNVCPTPEFILMLVINTQSKHSQEVA